MTENGHSRDDAERLPNGSEGQGSPDVNGDGHCAAPPALNVRVEPFGPDQARIDQSVRALLAHPRVLELVSPGEHRLLSFALEHEGEAADCTSRGDKQVEACSPHRFIGTVYDYAENRVIEIRGPLYALEPAIPGSVEVRVLGHQPLPDGPEFAAAVEIVKHERDLRERLGRGEIAVYRPMPPFIDRQLPG